jgi:flagellar basal body P-ring formation protein FlgA
MMKIPLALCLIAACTTARAETLVAARTVRAQAILSDTDIVVVTETTPGALAFPDEAIGLEARVALYAGRPIRPDDLGPPSIIERNQIVPLVYAAGGLAIQTEGRALARGGVGDAIRVMNLASRTTVNGLILPDGSVQVGPSR